MYLIHKAILISTVFWTYNYCGLIALSIKDVRKCEHNLRVKENINVGCENRENYGQNLHSRTKLNERKDAQTSNMFWLVVHILDKKTFVNVFYPQSSDTSMKRVQVCPAEGNNS